MKATATIIFLLSCLFTFGQLDIPFADSNAFWTQTRYIPTDPGGTGGTPIQYVYSYVNFGTTDSIAGMKYYELFTTVDVDFPTGHYRIDSNKVYYRQDYATTWDTENQHGVYTNGEYLLYDFGIQIGDTFDLTQNEQVILISIDSIQIASNYYRRFNFDPYTYQAPPNEYYWIEGVGSSVGFYPYFNNFEDFLIFECFSEDSIAYIPAGSICGFVGLYESKQDFKVYPNPTNDFISIEIHSSSPIIGYIVNVEGKELMRFEISEKSNSIDVSSLNAGVYFIRVNEQMIKLLKN